MPYENNNTVRIDKPSMMLSTLAFVAGVFFVQQLAVLPSFYWLSIAVLFALFLLFVRFFGKFPPFSKAFLSLVAIFLLGISWASVRAHQRLSDELPHVWEQQPVLVEGVVASVPEVTERGERFRFDVEKMLTPQAKVPRNISLSFYYPNKSLSGDAVAFSKQKSLERQFKAGERWQLTVRLKRPHGTSNPHGFDFEAWALAEHMRATGSVKAKAGMKKINTLVWQPAYLLEHWRESIKENIADALKGQPYVGVIQALVMGDDSTISAVDWQIFLRTGTTHLMSISGLHITMLAGLAFMLVKLVWRRFPTCMLHLPAHKAGTLAGVLVACFYALIAGFSVPTQRTLYMLLVFALAVWSGKKWPIAQVLALALLVVVLWDPWAVISAGFWLSFLAVAVIAYALDGRLNPAHWLFTAVQTQWAVTIGMLPILLILFHQASLISPLANAVAIPVISFVVTPMALLGSFLSLDFLLQVSHYVLHGLMWMLQMLNQWPMAIWNQAAPPVWTLLPAFLGAMIVLLPRGIPLRFLGVAGFLPMLLILPEKPMVGAMKVTVLDVGQGLSVVVQTATHTLLYDAGPKYSVERDAGNRIILPFLLGEGVHQLDGMVVSHDDEDHSGGVQSILQTMPVAWVMRSFTFEDLPKKSKALQCKAGQTWVWDKVKFEVLYPITSENLDEMKDNNQSCVLKVSSQFGSLLLTGDIEKEAENILIAHDSALKSDVLVVPHHGSKTSSQADFVHVVSPSVSVFTVGYLNRFGHPKPMVLERYAVQGSKIYRSDRHGAVIFNFTKNTSASPTVQVNAWRDTVKYYWVDDWDKSR